MPFAESDLGVDVHGVPIVAARVQSDEPAGTCRPGVPSVAFAGTMAASFHKGRPMRILFVSTSLALALASAHAQDAAAGGMAFMQCAECHSPGSGDGAGPGLKGVFGRHAAAKEGFAFSPALKAAGIVWDDKSLDAFLADPK